ncbi:MAG TPA: ComEC/Rec2 family competence protein [Devosia sp.]|jgi:competence protein ComEC|uniref:ComEC/Rec2 family competence protein n=1 Tax=Devosia sp. TaxID=1871048 RepID=UPI002DDCA396|nr:ComEC/Rec2 family competence protein [Devosia sp.]HEV2516556.1 ComEC/Rec2 family competence protein [Devosia sp.]
MTVTVGKAVPERLVPARAEPVSPVVLPPALRPRLTHWQAFRASITDALEQRRLFLLWPYAAIVGLIVCLAAPDEPQPWLLGLVGAAIAIGLVLVRQTGLFRSLTLVGAFWAGFALLSVHGTLFGSVMLVRPAYGTYEMRVDEIVSELETGTRAIVSSITATGTSRAVPMRRARIIIPEGPPLAPGDIIRAPVRFYAVPGPVVPNGFDSQFHAFFDGVGAYGNATAAVERVTSGSNSAPERIVDGIRRGIAARVDADLEEPTAGIARALITGDQSAVSDEARDTMAAAGLAHVLSVSGLHLTIVAGLVLVTLRGGLALIGGIHRSVSVKQVAAAGAIVAALGYFAISGGNVAALRSTIMLVLVLGAVVFGRRALTMRNVAIAALIVIATDPASVLRPSFQLSFAAVVALIGAWELMRPPEGRDKSLLARTGGYLWGIVLTSFIAGAATLLFSVYHFQQTSPLGVVGNLFTLPLVGFVMMPSAVLATLAMPLGWEAPFLAVMGWSIDRMLELGALVAGWSSGLDASPLLAPVALLLGLAALAWFTFFSGWHRLIAPLLLLPAVLLFALDRPPDVLIADTTQAVALRGDADLELVVGKGDSFAVDVWRETYGEAIEPGALLQCDSVGCFGSSGRGFSVAIVRDPSGFYEDCGMADLLIARRSVPANCGAGTVIDAAALARGGVHWLRWDAARGGFEIRPAIPEVSRPWRLVRP